MRTDNLFAYFKVMDMYEFGTIIGVLFFYVLPVVLVCVLIVSLIRFLNRH